MPRLYTYENVPLLIYPKNGVNNLNDESGFTGTDVQYRLSERVHDASEIRSVSHLQLRYDLSCSAGVEAGRRRLGLLTKSPPKIGIVSEGSLGRIQSETTVLDRIVRERLRSAGQRAKEIWEPVEGIGGRRKRRLGLTLGAELCLSWWWAAIFYLGACGRMPGAAIRCSRQVCDTVRESIHPSNPTL